MARMSSRRGCLGNWAGLLGLGLKQELGQARLPNDAQQRPNWDRIMHGDRNGDGSVIQPLLHDSMVAPLAHK